MNDSQANTNRLLQSVGVHTFVTYFHDFRQKTVDELIDLFRRNDENWTEGSAYTKANIAKRIFDERRELEALKLIVEEKNENSIPDGPVIKEKARQIYQDYSV